MTPSCHVKQHLQPEFRWVYKAPSRLSLGSEVEAREPTPVACMFRPYRTRGQWEEPYGVVHKGGVQLLSYLSLHRGVLDLRKATSKMLLQLATC
jgi:hypothetical protein